MRIDEPGKGRRVRCPICNAMFTIESAKDYEVVSTGDQGAMYASLNCPDCGVPIRLDLTVTPKQDVFVAGRV